MRRVPSVNPDELQRLCNYRFQTRALALDGTSMGLSQDTHIRELELHRFGLHQACRLPAFLQRLVFRIAASVPLESTLPEMIEQEWSQG